jgi:hypothetical protein
LVDEYSLVIQEFFQKRVALWLETVGKVVFDIKHHWVRFEFAPARGQIHAHLLAICGKQSFNIAMHKLKDDKEAQAIFLQNWSKKAYDYSAEVDVDAFKSLDMSKDDNPVVERLGSIDDHSLDSTRLQRFCQNHTCSGYCLRKQYGKKKGDTGYQCRVCRVGAGTEATAGEADTPGFELRDGPAIVSDKRGFQRLEVTRNHDRVVQSSLDMLRSWRGNCDFQIMIYDCDPNTPDPSEIARVTDYVVAYACKGNQRLLDEKKQLKSLILSMSDDTGTKHDVVKLARHLLNRAASNRTVSKQECMVLLAGLDLVMCSESIETVSISGQYRLQKGKNSTILKQYELRPSALHHLSLDSYFHLKKNSKGGKLIIPHYVGGRSQPVYPASEGFARATFLIHSAWHKGTEPYNKDVDLVEQFELFLKSDRCPDSVKIPYERMRWRFLEKLVGREAVAKDMENTVPTNVDEDILELLAIASTFNKTDQDSNHSYNYDKGLDYEWDRDPIVRQGCDSPELWLDRMLSVANDPNKQLDQLEIPLKSDGSEYVLSDLWADQRQAMARILSCLRDWLSHLTVDDEGEFVDFKPLRLTIIGAAGTGKSVLINTLVSVLRKMFDDNDVVQVAAPTGTAAFNVGGETLHRLFAIMIEDEFNSQKDMSENVKKRLRTKFKNTVALLIDERSMVSLRSLGTACANVKVCAHGGHHTTEDWAGIPIVILLGDDYQLPPPMAKGAFDILVWGGPHFGNQAEALGAEQFLACAEEVFELGSIKRTRHGQDEFKAVLEEARVGTLNRETAEKLVDELSLLKNHMYTETEKEDLFKDALFISANRNPVEEYNLLRLSQVSGPEKPVAILKSKTICQSKKGKSHMKDDNAPASSLFCVDALVSICGRNFWPRWGLHNGALGTVVEIIFAKGDSPNNGNLPLYVVVDFKTYCGPAWDKDHPTVSYYRYYYCMGMPCNTDYSHIFFAISLFPSP